MKRFSFISRTAAALVAVAAVASVLAACAPRTADTKKTAAAGACTLVYSEGIVTMDGKPVEAGTVIPDGAVLKTDAAGMAEMVFDEKNIIRMGPNTVLSLELGTLQRVVRLESGTFAAVLRKLDRLAGGSLELRTPAAVAGVRGTSFFARVTPGNKQTYFCTCNGTLAMTRNDSALPVSKTANHHDSTIYEGDPGSAVLVPVPAGFDFGHTDRDLEQLAAKIGETIDWTKAE